MACGASEQLWTFEGGGGGLLPVVKINQRFADYILLYVLNRNEPCMKLYSTPISLPYLTL
jgi:hypothetical protein